ncbi:3-hydroxybutyrate dehydrogenase [Ramlibacter sp.]|uniref:3-hydroxybutyrate dehydrogenase n=1 Tax=Ramlibacter sp. TaxID=1917967 RepID=UPI002BDA52CF|nr:3-hydroxybutyrate dehydrogenase [Ramlibacter sp.]HWI82146.1 3-hydroxybutyrate dehydrogenase [Ramlibacter sp.]
MSEASLQGRRALVTGSVQGIGLAIAQALGRQGCSVALHGLATPAQAQQARASVLASGAPAVEVFTHDLREASAVQQLMEAVLAAPLDILVNNAGIQHTAALADMPRARWDDIIAINLSAAFDTMRLALPKMAQQGYGRVVNIASVHGLVASVNKAPYVAAKFGLVGMSRVAALEYASTGSRASGGVTVNCICPGWTETAIIQPQIDARAAALGVGREDAVRDLLKEKQPSLRTSLPDEIARVVCWLCEPAAHNLTGAAIPVDGGWTAQ